MPVSILEIKLDNGKLAPLAVGNSTSTSNIKFLRDPESYVSSDRDPNGTWKNLTFLGSGLVSSTETNNDLLGYWSSAPAIHSLIKAYGVERTTRNLRSRLSIKTYTSLQDLATYLKAEYGIAINVPPGTESSFDISPFLGKPAQELITALINTVSGDAKASQATITTNPASLIKFSAAELVVIHKSIVVAAAERATQALVGQIEESAKKRVKEITSALGANSIDVTVDVKIKHSK